MQSQTNPANVARGHKAALRNPNVSEEAKEHSRQVLDETDSRETENRESYEEVPVVDEGKNIGNVIGGHKAATKNPNVSEEAKEHSKQVLKEVGA